MGAIPAGTVYFAVVFAVGFCLGVLRTLLLLPRLGPVVAVAIELPIILGVAWLVCARILRRAPLSVGGAAAMGAVAFALLMVAEAGVSRLFAGRSLAAHLALYAQTPHWLGLAGQLGFAGFPWLQVRRSRPAHRR